MWATFTLSTSGQIRGNQLIDEIYQATGVQIDEDRFLYRSPDQVEADVPADRIDDVQAVVTAHVPDPLYFISDHEHSQGISARDTMRQYAEGLHLLSPHDKAYAVLGRAFAANDGSDLPTILAIDSKASAQAYVASKPEFQALTPDGRAWVADELNAIALVLQTLLVFAL
jgi:hypothetical protein